MNSGQPHMNSLWADLIVEELVRSGIDYFCLSPGSRSTPLTAAAALHPQARTVMHFDERGAAFHALGYARATGRPAVLVCTSGTAAVNYFSAIVEASMDRVPMLVLTADRPPELRGTGANQTIDQVKLYGVYVRQFVDLPCPDDSIPPRFVLTTIDEAVSRALQDAGPVHLNCPFREPLAPIGPEQDFSNYLAGLDSWRQGSAPFTSSHSPVTVCEPSRLEDAARLVNAADSGIIVLGRVRSDRDRAAAMKIATALDWPVLPDIGSGLHLGQDGPGVIAYYDQLLADERFATDHVPSTVLHLGSAVTSKRLQQWLARVRPENVLHIENRPERTDPEHLVTHRYQCDIAMFCDFLLPFIMRPHDQAWRAAWQEASTLTGAAIDSAIDGEAALNEPGVARLISRQIDPDACLFVASSMPIRDMDMFADPSGSAVPLGCNRGASGIDGMIASFTGFSAGHDRRGTLLIGDLAFLHDLNSLALVRRSKQPLTLVVINNNGGGIFSFLPVAERTDLFERFFATPHDLSFEATATMFDLAYTNPSSMAEFEAAYGEAQKGARSTIIELRTDRDANHTLHRRLLTQVGAALHQ